MNTAQNGIWAGLLATGPMTLGMFALQKRLPQGEKSPLPPATLTSQTMAQVGIDQKLGKNPRENLTMLAHFGYGAACGLLYALFSKKITSRPLVKGSLFGIGVWAASYAGWLPMLGFRANAFNMPAKRNGLMVAAHLIWGACLAFAENEMQKFGDQMLNGRNKAPLAE
jgi:uncharacterized membrane protein YagU involved in acid resistance